MMKAIVVPVTPLQQNCTIAWCDETMKGCAVDPGGEVDKLMSVLADQGVTLEKIFICLHNYDQVQIGKQISSTLSIGTKRYHLQNLWDLAQLGDNFF